METSSHEEGRQWMTFGSYIIGTGSIKNVFAVLHQAEKSRRTYSMGPDFMSAMFLTLSVTHHTFSQSLLSSFCLHFILLVLGDKPGSPFKDGDSWGTVPASSAVLSQPACGRGGGWRRTGTLQHSMCLALEKQNLKTDTKADESAQQKKP